MLRMHLTPVKPVQFNFRITPIMRDAIEQMARDYEIEKASLVRHLISIGMKYLEIDLEENEAAQE